MVVVASFAMIAIFSPIAPGRANAQIPSIFVPVYSGIEHATKVADATFQNVVSHGLNVLAYTAAQSALDIMTQNTVSWIKGGFNGSPAFATDPGKFFLDVANATSQGLANQIRSIETCNFDPNFNNNLANMVEMATRNGATAKFQDQLRCPFNSSPNLNANEFFRDFNKGGWKAFEISLSDSGNPFGNNLLASQELIARQMEAKDLKVQQLSWGAGFLPMEVCEEVSTNIDAQGAFSDDAFGAAGDSSGKTTNCKTTTPGKVIGDQLNTALGTDTARLGLADNMDKIFAALIGELTKSAVQGIF